MSDVSNPSKAGRGDRRRAQNLINAAYAAGRLTSADLALRTDRVASAHTKGDLAVLIRDLNRVEAGPPAQAAAGAAPTKQPEAAASTVSLGSAIPPEQLKAMATGGSARTLDLSGAMKTAMSGGTVKTVRRVILISVLVFLLLCGLGIAGLIGTISREVKQAIDLGGTSATPSPAAVNLHTPQGWSGLVDAIKQETGSTRVYDAVVYPEYASVNTVVEEGAQRLTYRGGFLKNFTPPVTPAAGDPVDLADIDPDLFARLPARTAKEQNMPDFESAYLIVNALVGPPKIMVYLQQTGKLSRWTIFDLDGKVIGGTPS